MKSGWPCPGILSEEAVRFRGNKLRRIRDDSPASGSLASYTLLVPARSRSRSLTPGLAVTLEDRATAFFVHHYVRQGHNGSLSAPGARGTNEYLPALLREECVSDALKKVVAAAGIAAMANAGNSTASWRGEAYTLYTGAVRQLRSDLYDPVRSKLDHTLAAVMLMGTFEVPFVHIPGPLRHPTRKPP